MERLTQEQNKYLSCLLDDVTGTEEMVETRKDFVKMHDCAVASNKSGVQVYFTGSQAEGLVLPGSDVDFMIDINNIYDIDVSESLQDLVQSTRANKFLIVADNVPPAFVRLKPCRVGYPILLYSLENMGGSAFLSSQRFIALLYAYDTEEAPLELLDEYYFHTRKIQGPSLEAWNPYGGEGIDNVYSIRCNFWPTTATEWKERRRQYSWPAMQDKEHIVQFGCHLVSIGHPLSSSKSIEWRLSFSIAERILVWSFNHTQMQCYAVMKLILKEFVKVKCTQQNKGVLCSYFVKTFLFWKYETTNPSFWQAVNLQECLMYLFQEFYTCILDGVLRHYFIPRFNLLEIKLTPDAQNELLTHFRELIEGGISMIGRCATLAGVWSKFCQSRERNKIQEHMREIQNLRILDNDNCTITMLSGHVFGSVIPFNPTKERISYENFLVAIDRAMKDSSGSPLPSLTKRFLFVSMNNEILKLSSQNKSRYKSLKILDTNRYGFDITSSKLWLATFLLRQGDYHGSLQKINEALSSIPPYALFIRACTEPNLKDKLFYKDMQHNTNAIRRAKNAWLIDIHIDKKKCPFVPRAIQIELMHCDPRVGIRISPFTYAYFLMFLCYYSLGQDDKIDHSLSELMETIIDRKRCHIGIHTAYNISGHCLLLIGQIEMARNLFLKSAHFTHLGNQYIDRQNAAHHYLSCM